LRPVAWAEDGVIEALEQEGNPNLLAVQWHPELSAADDPAQQGLFDRLVMLAAG
jgi:putative glutamine amidotransferase